MIYALGDRTPSLADDCWVAPSAEVIGSVTAGPRSSIWFQAVVRGDCEQITIGEDSNVQDCAVLHADLDVPLTIGRGVTIGHHAMVHGCTIGDHCLIGINAVILNHAKIGKHCIIGANALVTEGTEVPDGSLVVGTPAKVIRQLDDKAKQMLEASASHYVANAARFREQLREV